MSNENPALAAWLVSASWHGKERPSERKAIDATSRMDAIKIAKAGFAANACRVWAIRDTPVVRYSIPARREPRRGNTQHCA